MELTLRAALTGIVRGFNSAKNRTIILVRFAAISSKTLARKISSFTVRAQSWSVRVGTVALAEIKWFVLHCLRYVVQSIRWVIHKLIYAGGGIALVGSAYVLPSPFIFAAVIWGPDRAILSSHKLAGFFSSIEYALVYPTGRFLEFAQSTLPHKCSVLAVSWNAHCTASAPTELGTSIQLHSFESVLHAIFAFCIGFGIIFEAGEVAKRELKKLVTGVNAAAGQIQDTMAGIVYSSEKTFVEWASSSHRRFEAYAQFCVLVSTITSYTCLLVTAFLAGFLLLVSPGHDALVIPRSMLYHFYAFAAAPFFSALGVILVVLMILVGRVIYPGRVLSRARWMSRENKSMRQLLDTLVAHGKI